MTPTEFISNPLTIGKHEWRIVVFNHSTYGHCTKYQWRRHGGTWGWKDDIDWPTYNHNDGGFAGMPKSLCKLYEREKPNLAPYFPRIAREIARTGDLFP